MSRLIGVKYISILFISAITLLVQSNWSFWAEEKITRLIDLSPKEEIEWSGSTNISTWSVKSTETSPKISEKKKSSEKIVPIKEELDKTGSTTDDEEENSKESKWATKDEKENVQSLINSYILDTYKAQWDKILKDMELSLQKKIPDISKRIQAYDSIQNTLELRKNRILKVNISDANKLLLSKYFDYMIESLEKRKENLEESLQN